MREMIFAKKMYSSLSGSFGMKMESDVLLDE